ncbi:hypothetical protein GCM10020358_43070 [Amorphoplanes nipponensis]
MSWDEEVLGFLHARGGQDRAELGRELGEYGADDAGAPDAPVADRMLGLTGATVRGADSPGVKPPGQSGRPARVRRYAQLRAPSSRNRGPGHRRDSAARPRHWGTAPARSAAVTAAAATMRASPRPRSAGAVSTLRWAAPPGQAR